MAWPIVFIHQGAGTGFNHLNYAALQARWWNPQARVVVIADQACRDSLVVPGLELVELEPFAEAGAEFRRCYRHFSPNHPDYERFCLERWFVLREFMKSRSIDRVFHFDSDVLLYTNLEALEPRFVDLDMTITICSWHSSMISTRALDVLCAKVLEAYSGSEQLARLEKIWQEGRTSPQGNGVSDMIFLLELMAEAELRFADLRHGPPPLFDSNINDPRYFRSDAGGRVIEFVANQPHGHPLGGGELRRFASLHFQGEAKRRIPELLRAPVGPLPDWTPGFIADMMRQEILKMPTGRA